VVNRSDPKEAAMTRHLLACLALPLLAACAGPMTSSAAGGAVAMLQPTPGNSATGTVRFTPTQGKLRVSGEVRGLKPNSEHGFHVHEKGDCADSGNAAGGHFNPTARPHGAPGSGSHAGDLPMLRADASGVARISYDSDALGVGSGPADVIGRALVVHRDPDDLQSQPAGNSGPRIACAVIVKG
jgi:superoxide dismutase, Cu-Zn family